MRIAQSSDGITLRVTKVSKAPTAQRVGDNNNRRSQSSLGILCHHLISADIT